MYHSTHSTLAPVSACLVRLINDNIYMYYAFSHFYLSILINFFFQYKYSVLDTFLGIKHFTVTAKSYVYKDSVLSS